jgi:glycine cleavage system H protein
VHAPVSGEVIAFNPALEAEPEALNTKPFDTWIIRLRPDDAGALDGLMDAAAYDAATGNG